MIIIIITQPSSTVFNLLEKCQRLKMVLIQIFTTKCDNEMRYDV